MIRGAPASACVLGALVLVASCRQIVGIGDRTVAVDGGAGAPACGLTFPAGSCRACMEEQCCSAAGSCASNFACKSNEECVAGCVTGGPCADACQISSPAGTGQEVSVFDACLASKCSAACGYSCGVRTPTASADAEVTCEACISANVCSAQTACATDVSCEAINRCNSACVTIDCAVECPSMYDAGAALWAAFSGEVGAACSAGCPPSWACVGHVSWPQPTASPSGQFALSVSITDLLDSTPTSGANVLLCTKDDPQCLQPLDDQKTDDAGAVTLHYANAPFRQGLDGYLQITSSTTTPALFFWNFPLTEPSARFGGDVSTLKAASLPSLFAVLGVTPLSGHGHLGIAALACSHSTASGVSFRVTPSDANTKIFYATAGGGLDVNATTTDHSGIAFIANVPAGPVVIDATAVTLGKVVSQVTILVRDGYVEQVYALPTPG